jgi:hypothetical protein
VDGANFKACRHPHHSDRTLAARWRRFHRLTLRFADVERIAHLRAATLRREHDEAIPAALLAAAPFGPDIDDLSIINISSNPLEVLNRRRRGRRHARACAHDGGGCASSRGPPLLPVPNLA